MKRFSSIARSSIACSSSPELRDLIEKQNAAVCAFEQTRAVLQRAGEGALHVAEQRRHRGVAAQCGAVDLDEASFDLAARLLELVDSLGELRLAGTGRTGQQDRRLRAESDLLDPFDQAVEGRDCGSRCRT